jgi:hypothetical protein
MNQLASLSFYKTVKYHQLLTCNPVFIYEEEP